MQPEDLTPERALAMLEHPRHPAVRRTCHAIVTAEFRRLRALEARIPLPQRPEPTEKD